jgi:hypothetical protein
LLLSREDRLWQNCCDLLVPSASYVLHSGGDSRDLYSDSGCVTSVEDQQQMLLLPPSGEAAVRSGWAVVTKEQIRKEGGAKRGSKNFCSICNRKFATRDEILAHIRENHPPRLSADQQEEEQSQLLFACFVCGKKFESQSEKFCHVRDEHSAAGGGSLAASKLQKRRQNESLSAQEEEDKAKRWRDSADSCERCGRAVHDGVDCWNSFYFCAVCPAVHLYT